MIDGFVCVRLWKPIVSSVLLGVLLSPPTFGAPQQADKAAHKSAPQQKTPRAAVVRVSAKEPGATSYGSGSLVAVSDKHGLVVTNWHVVRDATGQISVKFPDGFRSAATVLKVDKTWDLAALLIWRPKTVPVEIAEAPPTRGDLLTIAGFGTGKYREATGKLVGYVSPGTSQPFEMVEVSCAARNGDSGGPIFNRKGQLAAVLFGSARGRTNGSHCRRVRWFIRRALAKRPALARSIGTGLFQKGKSGAHE